MIEIVVLILSVTAIYQALQIRQLKKGCTLLAENAIAQSDVSTSIADSVESLIKLLVPAHQKSKIKKLTDTNIV